MIKTFFEENTHLKLSIQHVGTNGGGFEVRVYNTTWDCFSPIFMHFVSDVDIKNMNVDFETIVMTPIVSWWEDVLKQRKDKAR